ncbi:MAG: hypothetical protein NTY77_16190 [Elusimicrobia bacterium]|nr:hypothetical protein [Elusimicrobiota bacterium]
MTDQEGAAPAAPVPPTSFGLEDILGDAFAAFKARFGLVLGFFVVFAVIQAVCGKLFFIGLFLTPHLIAGFSLVLLKLLRDETPVFTDLFKGFSYYIPVLVAGLLMGVFLTIGLFCLVAPGVFLGLMWSQTMFLLADDIRSAEAGRKDKAAVSGWSAMQRSAVLMDGQKLRFLGYAIVLAIIGLAGAVAVGIGVLITIPFAWLAGAAFYNRLTKPAH